MQSCPMPIPSLARNSLGLHSHLAEEFHQFAQRTVLAKRRDAAFVEITAAASAVEFEAPENSGGNSTTALIPPSDRTAARLAVTQLNHC
jgi:hypothetical protein